MKRDYKNTFQEFIKIVQGICGGNSSNGDGKKWIQWQNNTEVRQNVVTHLMGEERGQIIKEYLPGYKYE